jgi:hypothetical protein
MKPDVVKPDQALACIRPSWRWRRPLHDHDLAEGTEEPTFNKVGLPRVVFDR